MFVVVIVDCAELQSVLSKNFRDVAIGRVVDVVIAVGTKRAYRSTRGVGEISTGQRKRGNAAQDVSKRQRTANSCLDVGRLREVLGTSNFAENRTIGIAISGINDEARRRNIGAGDIVLMARGVCGC